MTRDKLIKELKDKQVPFTKLRFYKESPFQKRRGYAKIEWEAWLYNNKFHVGFLITEETFNNKVYFKNALEAFIN